MQRTTSVSLLAAAKTEEDAEEEEEDQEEEEDFMDLEQIVMEGITITEISHSGSLEREEGEIYGLSI